MSKIRASGSARVAKNRKARQLNTLGGAIQSLELRLLLSSTPPDPHPLDDTGIALNE